MRGWHILRGVSFALLLASGLVASGCHHATAPVPLLGVGPLRLDDPTLYDDVLTALREAGHPPVRTDPEHGRFAVRASSDPNRETLFVVQCSRDGFVVVTPEGAQVERQGDVFSVTPELRTEWTGLISAIERSVPESR